MKMIDPAKVAKLIDRLQHLVTSLNGLRDRAVHRHINQFYYMQKTEELLLLLEQLEETQLSLERALRRIDRSYQEVFQQWQRDVRWLGSVMGAGKQ